MSETGESVMERRSHGESGSSAVARSCLGAALASLIQILLLSVAVIIAAIEIETIVASGPVLSVTGVVVAIYGWRSRSIPAGIVGLSAFLMSIFLVVLINLLDWSPRAAQFPVSVILMVYEAIITPVALIGSYRLFTRSKDGSVSAPIQYSLRSLLAASLVVGAAFTVVSFLIDHGWEPLVAGAVGCAGLILIAILWLGFHAFSRRTSPNV